MTASNSNEGPTLVWDLFLYVSQSNPSKGKSYLVVPVTSPSTIRGQVLNLPKMVWNYYGVVLVLALFMTGCMPPKNAVKLGSGLSVPEDTIRQLERQEGLSRSEALEVLRYQMESLEENGPPSSQDPQDSGE